MQMNVEKVAEIYGVTKAEAYGLLHFLAAAKIINTTKAEKVAGKRGRAATLYHLDTDAFKICAEIFRVKTDSPARIDVSAGTMVEKAEIPGEVDAARGLHCEACHNVYPASDFDERGDHPNCPADPPVQAAVTLSLDGLAEAAREGVALGSCDEE